MTLWMTSLTGYDAGWRGDGAQGEDVGGVGLGVGGAVGGGGLIYHFSPMLVIQQ